MAASIRDDVFAREWASGKVPSIPPDAPREDHVYLLGGSPYEEYRAFLTNERLDDGRLDPRQLADEWRIATVYLLQLRITEPGWADNPPVAPVPDTLSELVARVHADPIFHRSFRTVPVELGIVELDRLVARQNLVNLAQVQRIQERLGPAPTPEQVFRLCLPFDHPAPRYEVRPGAGGTFEFVSESNDLRHLETVMLRPEQLGAYQPSGPLVGVLGVMVGFGSNYLNVVAVEQRLVLNNGCHRAYALRELGITHVPCVIQRVSNRQELEAVAVGSLRRTPDLYLKEPRPPVVKDYFESKLRKVLRLVRARRHVRIRITAELFDVPEA